MTEKNQAENGQNRQGGGNYKRSEMVRDAMTRDLVTMDAQDTLYAAAGKMRDESVGDVLVTQSGKLIGIVTDRDIVVKAVAESKDMQSTPLQELCQGELFTVNGDASLEDVMRLMEEKAVRRIPVVEGGKPIGIVSLGDLAILGREREALENISAAPPNN